MTRFVGGAEAILSCPVVMAMTSLMLVAVTNLIFKAALVMMKYLAAKDLNSSKVELVTT